MLLRGLSQAEAAEVVSEYKEMIASLTEEECNPAMGNSAADSRNDSFVQTTQESQIAEQYMERNGTVEHVDQSENVSNERNIARRRLFTTCGEREKMNAQVLINDIPENIGTVVWTNGDLVGSVVGDLYDGDGNVRSARPGASPQTTSSANGSQIVETGPQRELLRADENGRSTQDIEESDYIRGKNEGAERRDCTTISVLGEKSFPSLSPDQLKKVRVSE